MMHSILQAVSNEAIERCFPVMLELRPHLRIEEFVERIRRQEQSGYKLIYLESGKGIKSLAGFRILESLAWGRFLYVDDLVTTAGEAGHGYGGALIDWLIMQAREERCTQFHLDSGVQRFAAHRFYFKKGLSIGCYHFSLPLT